MLLVDQPPHGQEQPPPRLLIKAPVGRVGAQQPQVALGVVSHREPVAPLLGPLEEPQTFYLVRLVSIPIQARRPPLWSELRRLTTVDVLEGLEEALAAALGVSTVPDERKRTVRPQGLSALSVADLRIDPVKRRGRDEEVEGLLLQRPLLEGASEYPCVRVVGQL